MTTDPKIQIVRYKDQKRSIELGGFKLEYLSVSDVLEQLLVTIQPGAKTQSFQHKGEEATIVLQGQLDITIDGQRYQLQQYDTIWHRSELPHTWENTSDNVTIVSTVSSPRTYSSIVMEEQEKIRQQPDK
jgi:quercetin dioxygenase-like cupin family protein